MSEDERRQLAERVRAACVAVALEAYEHGGLSGLCAEGRWELAVDRIRSLPLDPLLDAERSDESAPP